MNKKFIEIHMLQNYAPSNLNRDDTGSVKDCVFGGYPRSRISSQCVKRSIRKSEIFEKEFFDLMSDRTKYIPEEIRPSLVEKFGNEKANKIILKLQEIGSGSSDEKKAKANKDNLKEIALAKTAQLVYFGKKEIQLIIQGLSKIDDLDQYDSKKISLTIHEIITANKIKPIDVALFGRMTTLEKFEEVSAACQVSHAISVNKFNTDFDYFTAVDDLQKKYEPHQQGSGHLSETEFTSSCYYKYFAIDYDAFVENIGGVTNNQLAINVIKSLLKAATLSHPTGKQNSFAAHNPAHFIGIEIKNKKVPVNLSNAFIKPIEPSQKNSLIEEASEKLAEYAVRNREAFSLPIKETAVFLFEKKEAKKEGKEIKKRIGDTFTPNESNRFDTLDGIINWLETELGA